MVGGVEQVHRLAGEEETVLPAFGHAPHHRGNPAAGAQAGQDPAYLVLGAPITDARLFALARGILAVILSSRLCSSFSGYRGAIAIPPESLPLPGTADGQPRFRLR